MYFYHTSNFKSGSGFGGQVISVYMEYMITRLIYSKEVER